ncbi:hypothetical protein AMS68_003205 [Peltaster fructicola]|uniref:DNA repair protein rhp7 treble clef domain-containing protein n=1 Tax=Peltaster fructicola TaxID=286661 RepID=A0A6H0XSU6_9PEZI|nr:hypothetical protein AMS68_003205 [Peltaster fructicola]
MSGRRSGNGIRGPQSALTDFLAANNISAAQIRNDYEQRRARQDRENAQASTAATPDIEPSNEAEDDDAQSPDDAEEEEKAVKTKKRKRSEVEAIEKIKKAKKAKKVPDKLKGKKKSKKRSDDEDDDDEYNDSEDEAFVRDVYKKARKAPGQFANCEICSKRFTVTPYSKDGPEGGLLCTPCGKSLAKDLKAENKAVKQPVIRKRRKMESDKLDGFTIRGAKTLQQMCIEKVVQNHTEVTELGDLPQTILDRLSAIFSKHRVLKPNTLPLFLRPDNLEVVLHDSAYLEVNDYKQIFAVVPRIRKLVIGNACQFKDEVVDYMIERCKDLRDIRIYAPNLVTNEMWHRLFREAGKPIEVVKLKYLDAAFEDAHVEDMVAHCPNLQRLKLESCRRLGQGAVDALIEARSLEHLSLQMSNPVMVDSLLAMIKALGSNLRTLSLTRFQDADDSVLDIIHNKCNKLNKLRFSENDTATDHAFAKLFTGWANPSLTFIDVNCTRDVDNNNPEGPEDAIGLASSGFEAMMAHSGDALRYLDIASCRHIGLPAFLNVFNGERVYPALRSINISFCNQVDTTVIVGIFKSCPALKKLVAFGCFDIGEVVVPRDIALIGIPKAQDAIEQFGTGLDVEEALGRMVEVA